ALLVADHADAFAVEAAETADDGVVLAEFAVPGERREIRDQRRHVIEAVGPLRVARDLSLLPRRQPGIEFVKRQRRLGFEPRDLVADRERIAGLLERPQLFDLGLQFSDRLFEIEIAAHQSSPDCSLSGCRSRTRLFSLSSITWV